MTQSLYTYTSGASAARAIIADLNNGTGLTKIAAGNRTGVVEMSIGTDSATTADSGLSSTASYTGADLGAIPTRGFVTFSITSTSDANSGAVLITQANGLTDVGDITTLGSAHFTFTATHCGVAYFDAGSFTTVQTITYSTLTAGTKYRAGFALDTTGVTIYLPDGTNQRVASTQFYSHAGRYCQFESFSNVALGPRATFYAVTFEALT